MQIVDTTPIRTCNEVEIIGLHQRMRASKVEPILIHATVSDVLEIVDIACNYQKLDVKWFNISQIDIARRVDSILAAVDSASFTLSNISIRTKVANGMEFILLVKLAYLIMPRNNNNQSIQKNIEATL